MIIVMENGMVAPQAGGSPAAKPLTPSRGNAAFAELVVNDLVPITAVMPGLPNDALAGQHGRVEVDQGVVGNGNFHGFTPHARSVSLKRTPYSGSNRREALFSEIGFGPCLGLLCRLPPSTATSRRGPIGG
jgi:hypothetical protein